MVGWPTIYIFKRKFTQPNSWHFSFIHKMSSSLHQPFSLSTTLKENLYIFLSLLVVHFLFSTCLIKHYRGQRVSSPAATAAKEKSAAVVSHPAPLSAGLPLTDGLGLFHGVPCSQDVLRFKGHHGLHLQDGGVGQSMVHAVFGSGAKHIKAQCQYCHSRFNYQWGST